MTKTVEIKNLTMYFEHTQTKAIDNLSFELMPQEKPLL